MNVLFYVPLHRTCDGACLLELETLEALRAQVPAEALQFFVILSHAGPGANEQREELIERRRQTLPAYVTAVVDDGTCPIPVGRKVVDLGLGPVKIVADRDLNVVAVDFCAELPPERRAFESIVLKAVRKLYRPTGS